MKAPIKKERKFIKQHTEFTDAKEALELTKEELRALHAKGYDFTLLRFIPSSQFKPPWRKLVDELLKKYMNAAQRKEWHKRIAKRYPRTAIEPTITILKEGEPTE